MIEHSVITTLTAVQLEGYAIAMEEAKNFPGIYAEGMRLFVADRAAIARGLIAREPPPVIRYWREHLHPDDGDADLWEALCAVDDVLHLTPYAMRSNAWPGRRWVVWEPWEDDTVTQVYATEAEAQARCESWPTSTAMPTEEGCGLTDDGPISDEAERGVAEAIADATGRAADDADDHHRSQAAAEQPSGNPIAAHDTAAAPPPHA